MKRTRIPGGPVKCPDPQCPRHRLGLRTADGLKVHMVRMHGPKRWSKANSEVRRRWRAAPFPSLDALDAWLRTYPRRMAFWKGQPIAPNVLRLVAFAEVSRALRAGAIGQPVGATVRARRP